MSASTSSSRSLKPRSRLASVAAGGGRRTYCATSRATSAGASGHLAGGGRLDRLDEPLTPDVLEQVAGSTGTQGLVGALLCVERGQHQHPRPGPGGHDPSGDLHHRHPHVHERHVRLRSQDQPHRLRAVRGLAQDVDAGELESAGLAHLPSGKFMANAAWLALTVMAHNLGRAVGQL